MRCAARFVKHLGWLSFSALKMKQVLQFDPHLLDLVQPCLAPFANPFQTKGTKPFCSTPRAQQELANMSIHSLTRRSASWSTAASKPKTKSKNTTYQLVISLLQFCKSKNCKLFLLFRDKSVLGSELYLMNLEKHNYHQLPAFELFL